MSLINIVTIPELYPYGSFGIVTEVQKLIESFTQALPKLLVEYQRKLHLDQSDREPRLLVNWLKPNKGSSTPDIWLEIHFSKSAISERQARRAMCKLSWIIEDWFSEQAYYPDDPDEYLMPSFQSVGIWGDHHETIAMERVEIMPDY